MPFVKQSGAGPVRRDLHEVCDSEHNIVLVRGELGLLDGDNAAVFGVYHSTVRVRSYQP